MGVPSDNPDNLLILSYYLILCNRFSALTHLSLMTLLLLQKFIVSRHAHGIASSCVSSVLVATMGQGLSLGLASRACPEQRVSVLLVALCAQSTPCARPREASTGAQGECTLPTKHKRNQSAQSRPHELIPHRTPIPAPTSAPSPHLPQPLRRTCWRGEECRWPCVPRGGARCARLRCPLRLLRARSPTASRRWTPSLSLRTRRRRWPLTWRLAPSTRLRSRRCSASTTI